MTLDNGAPARARGVFVTFEGGDGVGKSTQAERLQEWLEAEGYTTVRTREPGGTEVGGLVRDIVLHHRGEIIARAEALLYAADRAQHVATVVRPALERGDIVIQDRYFDSSLAYQGAGRVLGRDEVRRLSLWAVEGLIPDVTVLLDLDPDIARERREAQGRPFDRLEAEQAEFHENVRREFLALADAEPARFLVVDASQPVDEIAADVRTRVRSALEWAGI
ncbi:dTMP kinase [Microbacterium immunditiarum]|uniref:Thymidylate kinase n=1 Tax=Microbacterium immunditiarum TaxID=337480 RepID=A0A7Y9GMZ9_9MICO|nr:dTMP kinase [Microbacterium immunditiarum]